MSIGAGIGGIIGAVVGWWLPPFGPMGSMFWGSIGMGIGSYIDPITPDMPTPGQPDRSLDITTAEVGLPIKDILGTTEVSGNFLWYGGNRIVEVEEKVDTGPFSHEHVTTGYKYYLSFAIGICIGPTDKLFSIFRDTEEEALWEGELERPDSGGEETINLGSYKGYHPDEEDVGSGAMTFYFGTTDQVPQVKMSTGRFNTEGVTWDAGLEAFTIDGVAVTAGQVTEGGIDATLNTPYRGLCWAFFDDVYIGESNRCPSFRFVMQKMPECSFDT